jgi:hypothetical protein
MVDFGRVVPREGKKKKGKKERKKKKKPGK